jgi:hypothetical protein
VDLVHDLVDGEIDLACLADPDWRRGLEAFARSYRQAFLRHPHSVALVGRRPIGSQATLVVQALRAVAVMDYLVLGSTAETFIAGFAAPAAQYRAGYPHLAAAIAGSDRDTVDDEAFDHGLRLLLDDLESTVTTPPSAAGRARRGRGAERAARPLR